MGRSTLLEGRRRNCRDEVTIRRAPMSAEARAVASVCVAQILGLAGFSLVPALLPQFIATWSLSNAEAGWLPGMMSAPYIPALFPPTAPPPPTPPRPPFL